MDKMRKEFEVEFINSLDDDNFSCNSQKLVYLNKDDNGDYRHGITHVAWTWWKASRESLCVDLDDIDCIHNLDRAVYTIDVKCKLGRLGVKYK